MPIRPIGGSGSGGGASIATDMYFATLTARNTWTTANPNRLTNGIACAVTNGAAFDYYQWDVSSSSWKAANLIFQGRQGDAGTNGANAPQVVYQYSIDGVSWNTTYQEGVTIYARWSVDGGVVFSDKAKIVGVDGKGVVFQYSADGATLWHPDYTNGDKYWRWSVDGGSNWLGVAKFVGDDAPQMVLQYSEDGATNWLPTPILGLTEYWRWSVDGGNTWSPNYVRYTPPSGSTGTGFPTPYEATVNGLGKLEIRKGGELISTQDQDRSVFDGQVCSDWQGFHTPTHTLGGAGANFVIVNNAENNVYFPSLGVVSRNGAIVNDVSVRQHSTTLSTVEVNGVSTAGNVDCFFVTNPPSNGAFFDVTIKMGEVYTGRLYFEQKDSSDTRVISKVELPSASYTIGQEVTFNLAFPLWLPAAAQVNVRVFKEGQSLVKAKAGTVDTAKPWRRASFRQYQDYVSFHQGNADEMAVSLGALTGGERIPAAAIRDFPIASGTDLGMIKVGAGFSIDGEGKLINNTTAAKAVAVSSQAAMLALPQIGNLYIANRTDTQTNWYLNANLDPAILANWTEGEYTGSSVVSYKGRTGSVVPEYGDVTAELVPIADQDDSNIKYIVAVKNGQLGIIRVE